MLPVLVETGSDGDFTRENCIMRLILRVHQGGSEVDLGE